MVKPKLPTIAELTRLSRRLLPSLLAFVGGSAAWVAVDAWLARSGSASTVEHWVALKTMVMVGSTLALAGLDGVVVREPNKARKILRWGLLNIVVVSSIISVAAYLTGYYDGFFVGALSVIGVALSMLCYAIHRAHLRYSVAQIARDGWKLVFLGMLWPLHFYAGLSVGVVLVVSLAIGLTVGVFAWGEGMSSAVRQSISEVSGYRSAMLVGAPFLMASFALSIASYGELLLVKWFGATGDVQPYFRAAILFSYPALMVSAYATTFLGPVVRQSPHRMSRLLHDHWPLTVAALLLSPAVTLALGYVIEPFLFPGRHTPLWLGVVLSAVAGLRLLYIVVSSFVGTLAAARELWRVTFAYFVAAVLTMPFCAFAIWFGLPVLEAVAVTAALHWLVRVSIGSGLTVQIVRRHLAPGAL